MLTREPAPPEPDSSVYADMCPHCGTGKPSSAKEGSTLRCANCGRTHKARRPASAPVMPARATADSMPPAVIIPYLVPAPVRPCELCANAGKRNRDGRYPAAAWFVRITLPDSPEQDGYLCTPDTQRVLTQYAGRGARVRCDPAGA
jgi:hypothetical protein